MTKTTRYSFTMFARLVPRTEWKTGRLAHTDLLTLDEGARYATLHSKTEVTPGDFLRAAARGEIRLHALCPREVTMQPAHSKHQPKHIAAGGFPTLPFTACQPLSTTGSAHWRTIDAFHVLDIDGELGRCVGWQLADGELDIQTTAADCRVTGRDVHALADAFIEPAPETAPAAETVPVTGETPPLQWWRGDYNILQMSQNIGDKLHSKGERTSVTAIAKEIANRINTSERSKGRERKSPNFDTIRPFVPKWRKSTD